MQGCQGGAHNPELRTVQGRGEEQGGWVRAELEVGGLERIQDVFVSEAARTDYYHKWSGFKQQKTYFSQLGTLEVWYQGISWGAFTLKALQENLVTAVIGIPWLAPLVSLPPSHGIFPVCLSVFINFLYFIRTPVVE